ncbi:MAG: hypothetical protein M3Z28_12100, partial [Candidatus Dormibacteraeota bacterium]|nr:hypothetical protein [Candidatus Dormibacteraeota bacterium]
TTSISYTPDGLRSLMTRPAGVKTSYGYDNADRLTSVDNDGPSGPLKDFSYALDAAANRTAVTSGAGTESYTLDALNRLAQVTYTNGDKATYRYDAAGNRLTQSVNGVATNYGYNAAGQLTTVGATNYGYDAEGNLISAGADSFSWDWAGRLSGATVSGTASTYTYDGDGTRVAARVGAGSTTNYLWDHQASLPFLVDDGSHGYVQFGGVLEQLDSGGASTATYPLADALGSMRGLSNASGTIASSADYEVFGAVRAKTGSSGIFGFTGEQTDATAFSYLRARYLSPTTGRFLSLDSVQPNWVGSQGYNAYTYAENNPTRLTDPSGRYFEESGGVGVISFEESAAVGATGFVVNLTLFRILLAISVGGGGSILLTPSGPLPAQPPAITNAKTSTKKDITTSVTLNTVKGVMTLADSIDIAQKRDSGSPYVAVDATVIISAVGKTATLEAQAAVDEALARRPPVVSPQAEQEFISGSNDVGALHHWFNVRGGGQGQPASDAEANALKGVAEVLGKPGLTIEDAKVAISAMKQFLPLMTGDRDLYIFLSNYLHYPAEYRVFY